MTSTTTARSEDRAASTPSPRRPRRSGRRLARDVLLPVIVLVAVVGVWWIFSTLVLDQGKRFLLPPPDRVLTVGFLDPANLGEILGALASTAGVALTGLGIAIGLGSLAALLMSQAVWVERAIYPWAVVLQTIPILAIVPLIGFWFGYGFNSRVLVCVLIALFPIITSTLFGLQSADRAHRELFRLGGAGRVTTVVKLLIPGALPAVLTGWRTSAGMAVTGAVVGDYFFRQAGSGIGRLLDQYTARLQSEQLFAGVLITSFFGLLVFWGFGALNKALVGPWHDSADGERR